MFEDVFESDYCYVMVWFGVVYDGYLGTVTIYMNGDVSASRLSQSKSDWVITDSLTNCDWLTTVRLSDLADINTLNLSWSITETKNMREVNHFKSMLDQLMLMCGP